MPESSIPTIVLGGSGYVAGEALRLLLRHPVFEVVAAASTSQVGQTVASVFPHLDGKAETLQFCDYPAAHRAIQNAKKPAVLSALPHGESRDVLTEVLKIAPDAVVVDLSADFRFAGGEWLCAPPDVDLISKPKLIANPGCFATAATLAAAPLVKSGWAAHNLTFFGVTGSTGSGRTPKPGTHHPDRHGGMWAYEPLRHRHAKEIALFLGRLADAPTEVSFLPHSGPFARGIHMTVVSESTAPKSRDELLAYAREFYAGTPFVRVVNRFPSVKEVSGSNRCHLTIDVEGNRVVAFAVIDNLVKGASGSGVQWLNRAFGLAEATGLDADALGWT